MNSLQVNSILPLIILSVTSIVIMLVTTVKRNHKVIFGLSLVGLIIAFYTLFPVSEIIPININDFLLIDTYTLFFWGLIFAATLFVILISYHIISISEEQKEEYYILIFTAALGSSVLVASVHFISFFLGLEILSISLYILIAYFRKLDISIEAGVKYLILAAAASAILVFGMSLLYAEFGTMNFYQLGKMNSAQEMSPIAFAGFAFLIAGIGFKLAVVPFHMWTPDVYDGASSPITAFIATVSKGGMFALLLRFYDAFNGYAYDSLMIIFGIIAIASMFIGNWLALLQMNVKKILAYSSIAHLGYLLVAFIAGGKFANQAVAFYLTAYFITTIGAFGVVSFLSNEKREAFKIDDYKGLFWKRPWLSFGFTAMILSLAGIPLTAGFVGKYYVLAAGVNKAVWGLVIILVLNSAIGLYYYLRIVVQMFSKPETEKESYKTSILTGFALTVLTLLLIFVGVYPTALINLIQSMVGVF